MVCLRNFLISVMFFQILSFFSICSAQDNPYRDDLREQMHSGIRKVFKGAGETELFPI